MTYTVVKRDGRRVPYDANMINKAIERAAEGLPDALSKTMQLASELDIQLFDGITTAQLDVSAIKVAAQNIAKDPDFDTIATRLFLKTVYKSAFGSYDSRFDLITLHAANFPSFVRAAVADEQLDPRLAELFDLPALAAAIDPTRDDLFDYIGSTTLMARYALRHREDAPEKGGEPLEPPQYFWMRVAMGLSLNEADPTKTALALYEAYSKFLFSPAGSTLANAGTLTPQLSNCFVIDMHDDIDGIFDVNKMVGLIAKGTGGIGLAATKLRADGSPIRSTNSKSTGPVPFINMLDATVRAISRGGKKFGAMAVYMENWHLNFQDFVDLRKNSGDPYRRVRTANTAAWISDEFMKRVDADDYWYLFDPLEVASAEAAHGDLTELYGSAFSAAYALYVEDAEAGRLRAFKKLRAREQWNEIIMTMQGTSHPWITFKDTVNVRALNDNTGTIHLSNLCTEITLPQDRDNVSVCNLASVNLARHVTAEGTVDYPMLERTTRLAVRQLDNLIDVTRIRVEEAVRSNDANRAVGLGLMGFTDMAEQLGFSYESPAAVDLIDEVTEFVSYHAIDASADLAIERGSYPNYPGSGWSKGLVPIDTIARAAADRGLELGSGDAARLDWSPLRAKVATTGIRNATLMAIAPTANIGLVMATTPGIDPNFTNLFSRNTAVSKFVSVNKNLVAELKRRDLWELVAPRLLEARGDLDAVPGIPEAVRAVYRTSFQIDPGAFVRVAAAAQKWVDQAISRNIYLASRSVSDADDLYRLAWKTGLKTTYYLHMQQRHTAEQSTSTVNKREAMAGATGGGVRRGFGAAPVAPVAAPAPSIGRGFGGAPAPALVPSATAAATAATAPRGFGAAVITTSSSGAAATTTTVTSTPAAPAAPVVAAEEVEEDYSNFVPVVCRIDPTMDPADAANCDACQ